MNGAGAPPSRRALLALAAAAALPRPARAAQREVVLLVPAPPGSAADRWTRGVAPFLERAWPRQRLVLRNHPGRGGLDGMAELAAVPADQKVIGVLSSPVLLARAVEAGQASPLDRLAALAALVEEPVVVVTAPGGVSDLAALRAGPVGAPLGTPPAGTSAHITGARLAEKAGLSLLVFPSAAAARQAAASGHVVAAALNLPDAVQLLGENRLVALGVASRQRSPLLPEQPTLREAGLELLGAARRGFVLSPGAPAAWRDWLLAGLETLATDPDLTAHCAEGGRVPRLLGPVAWGGLLRRQDDELRRRWAEEPWLPRRA